MPSAVLRMPPMGAPIGNGDGGTVPVDPGEGFVLRCVDAPLDTSSALILTGAFQDIPLVGSAALELVLQNPNPDLRYHAEIGIPIENGGASAYTAQLTLAFQRTDSGGTPGAFVDQTADQRFNWGQTQATLVNNMIVYKSRSVLGRDLIGAAAVQAGDQSLAVRFRALGTNNATIPAGSANRWARFCETL